MTTRAALRCWSGVSPILMISTWQACGSDYKVRNADPQEAIVLLKPTEEAMRSMHIEQGRLGLDQTLQVRASKQAVPHELRDGDKVQLGDRIRATVVTSEDANVYLAFCARRELAIYPSRRGVRIRAGTPTPVPEGDGELVVDGDPGSEVLYIIVSRTELSLADPRLADALATGSQGAKPVDCGAGLDADLSKPSGQGGSATPIAPPSTNVLRGNRVRRKPMPAPAARTIDLAKRRTKVDSDPPKSARRQPSVDAGVEADPDFIRSPGTIVWYGDAGINGRGDVVASDADGIAVVRYRFTHTAKPSSP
jgi:Domain of unknown function (DUF4384)